MWWVVGCDIVDVVFVVVIVIFLVEASNLYHILYHKMKPLSLFIMPSMLSVRFCFTYNNYSYDEIRRIVDIVAPDMFKLAFFQYEIGGENGVPHLQGFFLLKKPARVTELSKKISKKMHYDAARGTNQQVWDYCHKVDTRDNTKDPTSCYWPSYDVCLQYATQSKYATKKLNIKDIINKINSGDVVSYIYDPNYIRHSNSLNQAAKKIIQDSINRSWLTSVFEPRLWQSQVMSLLDMQTNRQVLWIYEEVGDMGKSCLASQLKAKHKYLLCDAKTSNHDLASLIDAQMPVGMVYDIPRSNVDPDGQLLISYNSLESIKNKFVFTGKYQGKSDFIASFDDVMRVLVLSNYPPDYKKLSKDRWQVYQIMVYNQHPQGVLEHVLYTGRVCGCFICQQCANIDCMNRVTCLCNS